MSQMYKSYLIWYTKSSFFSFYIFDVKIPITLLLNTNFISNNQLI